MPDILALLKRAAAGEDPKELMKQFCPAPQPYEDCSVFYIRTNKDPRNPGSHPIACVAITHLNGDEEDITTLKGDEYRVSWYVHNANHGAFKKDYARMTAVGRLDSQDKYTVASLPDGTIPYHSIFGDHPTIVNLIAYIDHERSNKAFQRAVSDLHRSTPI